VRSRTSPPLAGALCLGLALFVAVAAGQSTAWAQAELFIVNGSSSSPAVTVHARAAGGDVVPLRVIAGAATGLDDPRGVVVDVAHDEVLISNQVGGMQGSVTVYPRTASGNVAPIRTLSGPATGLSTAQVLALDPVHDEIVVASFGSTSIVTHQRTATGNAAPLRTLVGAATGLNGPFNLLVDVAHDELIVANLNNDTVTVYPRTAAGNTAPIRTIGGAATGFDHPRGLALDPVDDLLLVSNQGGGVVMAFPRTATGNVPPLRTLTGAATGLDFPFGLVVDPANDELVVMNNFNGGPGTITVYPRTAQGNASPIRVLAGANASLRTMNSIAVAGTATPALISTGTGPTGGPHVKLFHFDPVAATPTQLGGGFFAYDPGFTGGVQAAIVRVQGSLYLVTGVGSGGGPHIKIFKVTDVATGAVVPVGAGFFAYDLGFLGGARVAATTDAAGNLLIVTGVGSGGASHVKVFQVTNLATGSVVQLGGGFFAYDPAFVGGVNVGAQ
jgi:hypothetical protein